MTEDGVRTRRNFPVETWAVVRDAYLGGETAESISRRLNMSINTIRKRATRCGWTHAAHAKAIQRASEEGPPARIDLKQAKDAAVAHAAALLTAGRALEASAMLRAAEALGRAVADDADRPSAEPEPPTAEQIQQRDEERQRVASAIDVLIQERANTLALDLLMDRGPPQDAYNAFAFRWRAMVLGPEVALADFAAGVHGGWASRYWDAEGRLIPQDPIPPMPDLMMVRQHLRHCQRSAWGQEDFSGWIWPPRDWWPEGEVEKDQADAGTVVTEVDAGPRVRRL